MRHTMSVVDDPTTFGRARLSFADQAEIDDFVATLDRFERGDITPDQWRAFRLVRGTYGQRQAADAQMLRVKIPQGAITSPQLRALAEIGERYSRKFGHITTRQNIQFHFVKLHDVEPAMRLLADAGITTREACGNSVRDRKSTRLNSSHGYISYAVFCLKKKKPTTSPCKLTPSPAAVAFAST